MTNNLISETSPYLLQHKNNPVNWYAWNDKTISFAKSQKLPILLSIGYSACHWCHVMAHESFEDESIAHIMNSSFINIKVDREERPDIDALYQAALSVMGRQGGWPLTMFIDISLKPFWGGTYFPKVSKHGLPSFKDVLNQISSTYKNNKNTIHHNSNLINDALFNYYNKFSPTDYSKENIKDFLISINDEFDLVNGGLSGSPKFPMLPLLRMLLYMSGTAFTSNIGLLKTLKNAATSLCLGGIYDHVGGGLSRYSTDEYWLVPHFEKMLYDNAQIIDFLSSLMSLESSPLYKDRIEKTFSWLDKEMIFTKSNYCAYFSAIDADSEGVEGLYYVWDYSEILDELGDAGREFALQYGAKKEGNWEEKNILNRIGRDSSDDCRYEVSAKNKARLSRLLSRRKLRVLPSIDNKILTDWNAMLICGLLRAYVVLKNEKYLNRAKGVYSFLLNNHFIDGVLYHSSCNGRLGSMGLLDDYANFIKASFFLYEVTGNSSCLGVAKELTSLVKSNFFNKASSDFYVSDRLEKNLFLKTTNRLDTATQSGSSIMLENLIRGFYYFGEEADLNLIEGAIKNSWVGVGRNPTSSIGYIAAAYTRLCAYQFVAIIKNDLFGKEVKNYLLKLSSFSILTFFYNEKNIPKNTAIGNKGCVNGSSTVYVCSGFVCSAPIISIKGMKEWVNKNMALKIND